jgi:cytochrome c oxidase assembly protein subunit 11
VATAPSPSLQRNNLRVGIYAGLFALAMLGMGYAAVPLYEMFCQVTGFGGTTQRATEGEARAAEAKGVAATRSIRFDANVDADLPWTFRPEQVTQTVRVGQRSMAFYYAKNNSDKPVTGTASFNVTPVQTGQYFAKVQCFCFTEQTLQPGQEVVMPVLFFVNPAIERDKNAAPVEQITLSYTFHRTEPAAE